MMRFGATAASTRTSSLLTRVTAQLPSLQLLPRGDTQRKRVYTAVCSLQRNGQRNALPLRPRPLARPPFMPFSPEPSAPLVGVLSPLLCLLLPLSSLYSSLLASPICVCFFRSLSHRGLFCRSCLHVARRLLCDRRHHRSHRGGPGPAPPLAPLAPFPLGLVFSLPKSLVSLELDVFPPLP